MLKLIVPRDGDAAAHESDGPAARRRRRLRAAVARRRRARRTPARAAGPVALRARPADRRRHEILVAAAARIWRPAPEAGLPTGAAKARWLAEFITPMWEELDRPCTRTRRRVRTRRARRVAATRIATRRRCSSTATCTSGTRSKPATGSSSSIPTASSPSPSTTSGSSCERTRSKAISANERVGWQHATGLDERAIWEWGVVERVSTGLLGTRVGLQPIAGEMLAAADALAQLNGAGRKGPSRAPEDAPPRRCATWVRTWRARWVSCRPLATPRPNSDSL